MWDNVVMEIMKMTKTALANVIPMPRPSKPSHRIKQAYLSPEQVEAVLAAALRHGRREHLQFLFAYVHGARCSEISGLRISDVNLEQNTVRIARGKGSETNIQSLQTSRKDLFNERAAMIEWIQMRRKDGATDSDFMFPGRDGVNAIDRTTIFRAFQVIAAQAGIPATHRHVHVLKHALGRNLVEANVSLPLIKKRLGHVSLAATAVYTTPTDSDADAATQTAMRQLFSKRGGR